MPKALEQRLTREARAKHLTGRRRDAYVFGTLARIKARQARTQAKSGRKQRGSKRRKG